MSDREWTFIVEPLPGYTAEWTTLERTVAGEIVEGIRADLRTEASRFFGHNRDELRSRRELLVSLATTVAQHAEVLQYGSPDERADQTFDLRTILVALAAQPGGVDFLGYHWCLYHELCGTMLLDDLHEVA